MSYKTVSRLLKVCSNQLYIKRGFKGKIRPDAQLKPKPPMGITICGANSSVGIMTALLLKRDNTFKNIYLYDSNDVTCLVKDLCEICTPPKIYGYSGLKNLPAALINTRIVFICENIQIIPQEDEVIMFWKNANLVRRYIVHLTEFNKDAFVIIGTPPITSNVPLAIEEYYKNDIIADSKVFGLAKVFESRARSVAANFYKVKRDPKNYVIGGCDRRTVVPILSHSDANNRASEVEKLKLTKLIKDAEENVIVTKIPDFSNTLGCAFSIAHSGASFAIKLAHAISGEKNIVDCAYVKQSPPMDFYAKYFTALVHLNKHGVESCDIPKLSTLEKKLLKKSLYDLQDMIDMGINYVTGFLRLPCHKPKCVKEKEIVKEKLRAQITKKIVCPEICDKATLALRAAKQRQKDKGKPCETRADKKMKELISTLPICPVFEVKEDKRILPTCAKEDKDPLCKRREIRKIKVKKIEPPIC